MSPDLAALNPGYDFSLLLDSLHRQRDALTDADAHGGKREFAAALLQTVHGSERKARTRHAQRVTKRNGPPVGIDVLGIVAHAQLAQTGKPLRRERLTDLDQIEIPDLESQTFHQLAGGRHCANAHDPRRYRRRRHAEDARATRTDV